MAEDNEHDINLLRHAFEKVRSRTPFQLVRDGEEVLAYLKGEGPYANRAEYPLPHLLLLDLKMPRMDGYEVLTWIRAQPNLKNLVVVVLTSSKEVWSVSRAYAAGANSFLAKPVELKQLIELLNSVQDYWLQHNRNPEISRTFPKLKPTD